MREIILESRSKIIFAYIQAITQLSDEFNRTSSVYIDLERPRAYPIAFPPASLVSRCCRDRET